MDKYYKKFIETISLSADQYDDGRTKYRGVCDCLAHSFYDRDLFDSDKLVFGSFKTRTQVLPMGVNQDVDVVFKIPSDVYESYKNRPGAMLQRVREPLKKKYTTTDKISAWGKVVLIDFSTGHHDVEVAPCFETEDGKFLIPNTCKSEDNWEEFDVRGQIDAFTNSNDASDGLTRDLVKIVKKWVRNTPSMTYKSYNIMNDVITFIDLLYFKGRNGQRYDIVVKDFFTYIQNNTPGHLSDYTSQINTAQGRAVKAMDYEEEGKHIEATEECRKIFGSDFPKAEYNTKREKECDTIVPFRPWAHD